MAKNFTMLKTEIDGLLETRDDLYRKIATKIASTVIERGKSNLSGIHTDALRVLDQFSPESQAYILSLSLEILASQFISGGGNQKPQVKNSGGSSSIFGTRGF